jgi:hypothetical protein
MHKDLQIPYVYDYITKSETQQEVIQNHENENVCYTGQGEARHTKYKSLAVVMCMTVQVSRLPWQRKLLVIRA